MRAENGQIAARAEALLSSMTLEKRAAQMIQAPYAIVGCEELLRWASRWSTATSSA